MAIVTDSTAAASIESASAAPGSAGTPFAIDVLSAVRRAILAINECSRLDERVGVTSTATASTGSTCATLWARASPASATNSGTLQHRPRMNEVGMSEAFENEKRTPFSRRSAILSTERTPDERPGHGAVVEIPREGDVHELLLIGAATELMLDDVPGCASQSQRATIYSRP